MGTDSLTGKRTGLSKHSGLGDFMRQETVRCANRAGVECHHRIRDAGNIFENAQMLCDPCHRSTESHSVPGLAPPPFPESVKAAARARCGGQCECTKVHPGHGYVQASIISRPRSIQR